MVLRGRCSDLGGAKMTVEAKGGVSSQSMERAALLPNNSGRRNRVN